MSNNIKAVTDFRKRRKENLVKVLGSCCSLCGYNKCVGALEFHHINPEDKRYQLSSGNCHNIEEDLEEVKKCLLVCSNCHREIHTTNLYEGIDLWKYQVYNDNYANELIQENKKEERKCSNCGIKISRFSKTGLCPSCAQLKRRIIERPDREELKKLIRELPFTKIAEKYNCSDNTIRKWCDKENLPRKKSEIDKYTDEQWENI